MRQDDLYERVRSYLAAHHTMTLATCGEPFFSVDSRPPASTDVDAGEKAPHAASVFYALGGGLRMVFLSAPSSVHGRHIGRGARVAATVTEQYADWREIQGVQLWGEARLLTGPARAKGLMTYLARFPFVEGLLKQAGQIGLAKRIDVYMITPERAAFTDNSVGVFGREVLDLEDR